MYGNWAFNWVQILAHNRVSLGWRIALVSLLMAAGLIWLPAEVWPVLPWLLSAVVVMALLMIPLFDTRRTALLMLGLSALIVVSTFGLVGWLRETVSFRAMLLGGVVVLTMMTSNLVHVLGTVLREMARGQFQHDAVAEALRHNAAPVVLANLTTSLGFLVAALFQPALVDMAWVVGLGALASLWVSLTWLPWLLLGWFLEFRVGHTTDRHGYARLVSWFKRHPRMPRITAVAGLLIMAGASLWVLARSPQLAASVAVMLAGTGLLLWLAWRDGRMVLLVLLLNALVVMVSAAVAQLWWSELTPLALLVPLGLVIDDAIHFFTRYLRARRIELFDTVELRLRFALGSVGRTLWMTTLLLMAGLSILLLQDDTAMRQAVVITDIAMLLASFMLVVWLPALGVAMFNSSQSSAARD